MANLYFLNYNCYSNRIVKKEADLTGYLPYLAHDVVQDVLNFNPGDGVDTTQVLNWAPGYQTPDYLVVTEGNSIISRWFVMDAKRNRNGQYSLTLHRDLVVDAYEDFSNSTFSVRNAVVPITNPLIYNSEGGSYNQIKTDETLLKDKTKCAWLIGYFARTQGDDTPVELEGQGTYNNGWAENVGRLEDWEYFQYINSPAKRITSASYDLTISAQEISPNDSNYYQTFAKINPIRQRSLWEVDYSEWQEYPFDTTNIISSNVISDTLAANALLESAYAPSYTNLRALADSYISPASEGLITRMLRLNGQYIQYIDDEGHTIYAKITVVGNPIYPSTKIVINPGSLRTEMAAHIAAAGMSTIPGGYKPLEYSISGLSGSLYGITLTDVTASNMKYDIPADRAHLNDAPYDMFAIPYGVNENVLLTYTEAGITHSITMTPEASMNIAQAIGEKYSGAGTVYDIQLLPYCPISGLEYSDIGTPGINFDTISPNQRFFVTSGISPNVVNSGVIFIATQSSFSFNVVLEDPIVCSSSALEFKIQNETDMYRICSPNYAGVFEFSATKNGGRVDFINVDATYKPYQPYVHLNPNFAGLYGKDFNDGSRGLLLGGDFSIAIISDRFASYELQNKNYQSIFDRNIQSLELQNKMSLVGDIASSVSNIGGGITNGFQTGGVIGGAIGGVLSAAGGAADVAINQTLRNDAIGQSKDVFNYNLGNIRALPDSLSKTSAFTANNKYFPFIEYYTCTEIEKALLRNKIRYKGMTLMTIGKPAEFAQYSSESGRNDGRAYFSGTLLYYPGEEDNHWILSLASEAERGLYI